MQKLLVQVVTVALVVRCTVSQSCSLDSNGNAVEMVDVLILGAGISGIAAARTLEVNGRTNFLVIEAYNRIGGRIREYDGTQLDDVKLEVGANWIQGLANDMNDRERHPIWREWLRCNQATPKGSKTPDDFTHVYDISGTEITTHKDYVSRRGVFQNASKMAKEQKSSDISKSLEKALKDNKWERRAQSPLDEFIEWEGVDFCSATQPWKISQYHHSRISYDTDFLAQKNNAEATNYLMADEKGFSYVVDCLARNFKDRILNNSKITKIKTAKDCVCVTVEGNDLYCGRYSIVTFSIRVLRASISDSQPSVFRFEPRLPPEKQAALNSITPVHYGKIHLQFDDDDRFWDDILNDKYQQILGNVATERGYYPYFIFDKNRPHTVTADVTGDLAKKVADQENKEETIENVTAILEKMFNKVIPEPHIDNVIISNWSIDPLFLCTYSVIPPGVSEEIFKDLLEPVNGRLYFAGEALNGSNSGFTQGGYGSGVCVAKLLLGEKRK